MHLARAALAAVALLVAAPASAVDLAGSWYVLVHYKDSATNNPDFERWEDRIWVFQPEASRLRWTQYPLVLFSDKKGRFERTGRQHARVLHFWEPNPGQADEIRSGLEVNPRGSKSKTLRRADGEWRSRSPMGGFSAGTLTYTETWSIEDPAGLPVFRSEESLGGARAESLEGLTEYRVTEVASPDLLRGTYNRDGTRVGTFRMLRAEGVGEVQGGTSQQEIRENLNRASGADPVAASAEIVREVLIEELEERGLDPERLDVDGIVAEYVALVEEGLAPDQIERKLEREVVAEALRAQYDFADRGAVHDDAARYRLPFDGTTPRQLSQGVGGEGFQGVAGMQQGFGGPISHKGRHRYSFDFGMPVGTPVLAARDGVVVRVQDGYTRGGPARTLTGRANLVMVEHADGTVAVYGHLSPGIPVEEGQAVAAGDRLGLSGNTGYTFAPHLHFSVWRFTEEGEPRSVDILFDDGQGGGFVPTAPSYYGG